MMNRACSPTAYEKYCARCLDGVASLLKRFCSDLTKSAANVLVFPSAVPTTSFISFSKNIDSSCKCELARKCSTCDIQPSDLLLASSSCDKVFSPVIFTTLPLALHSGKISSSRKRPGRWEVLSHKTWHDSVTRSHSFIHASRSFENNLVLK